MRISSLKMPSAPARDGGLHLVEVPLQRALALRGGAPETEVFARRHRDYIDNREAPEHGRQPT